MSLLHTFNWLEPTHTRVNEDLNLRPQLGLVQGEIVDGSNAHVLDIRGAGGVAPHERAASVAPPIGHSVVRGNSLVLSPLLDLVFAADISQVRILDGEVGRKH